MNMSISYLQQAATELPQVGHHPMFRAMRQHVLETAPSLIAPVYFVPCQTPPYGKQ